MKGKVAGFVLLVAVLVFAVGGSITGNALWDIFSFDGDDSGATAGSVESDDGTLESKIKVVGGSPVTGNTMIVAFTEDSVFPSTEMFYYSFNEVDWIPMQGLVRDYADFEEGRIGRYVPLDIDGAEGIPQNIEISFRYTADTPEDKSLDLRIKTQINPETTVDPLSINGEGESCSCKSLELKKEGDNPVKGHPGKLGSIKRDAGGLSKAGVGDSIGPGEAMGFGFSWVGKTEKIQDGKNTQCKEWQKVQSTTIEFDDQGNSRVSDIGTIGGFPPKKGNIPRTGGKPAPGTAPFPGTIGYAGKWQDDNYITPRKGGKDHNPDGSIATSDYPTMTYTSPSKIRHDRFLFALIGSKSCYCEFYLYHSYTNGKITLSHATDPKCQTL